MQKEQNNIYGTDYKKLVSILEEERKQGKKVVMASGTFDLFHLGHMRMLAEAKKKGDILVVAVKSDKAAALKKEDPPVLNQEVRMETIANCISADYVVLADYDPLRSVPFNFANTPSFEWLNIFTPVVEALKPDIFVHEDNVTIREARKQLFKKYNVEGVLNPRTEGISTTDIIDKIKTRLLLKMQQWCKDIVNVGTRNGFHIYC